MSPLQFDGKGNYTFGLTEQVMFHEIDQDRVDRLRGMDITFVTTAGSDDEGRALLRHLGFPFKADVDVAAKAQKKGRPAVGKKKK
jgi:large subunit ribosomal protein L5